MNIDIALCIGHSRWIKGRRDCGAVSVDGTSEWEYNEELADLIAEELGEFEVKIYDDYHGTGYTSAMQWLAGQIRRIDAACAIELHFNSAPPQARGHEWLHWHRSANGLALAERLEAAFDVGIPARGVKPIDMSGRGGVFLKSVPPPAVIAEPFFGSNIDDWRIAQDKPAITRCMAKGIRAWFADGFGRR
jgi:N-acetylmuramoyl-L-alanine amidase